MQDASSSLSRVCRTLPCWGPACLILAGWLVFSSAVDELVSWPTAHRRNERCAGRPSMLPAASGALGGEAGSRVKVEPPPLPRASRRRSMAPRARGTGRRGQWRADAPTGRQALSRVPAGARGAGPANEAPLPASSPGHRPVRRLRPAPAHGLSGHCRAEGALGLEAGESGPCRWRRPSGRVAATAGRLRAPGSPEGGRGGVQRLRPPGDGLGVGGAGRRVCAGLLASKAPRRPSGLARAFPAGEGAAPRQRARLPSRWSGLSTGSVLSVGLPTFPLH